MGISIRTHTSRVRPPSKPLLTAGMVALVLALDVTSPVGIQAQQATPSQATPTPAPTPVPVEDPNEPSAYKVGAGDTLRFFVWKEPDLSGELQVRMDGKVTIPLLGDVEASSRTTEQLATEVSKALKRYLA